MSVLLATPAANSVHLSFLFLSSIGHNDQIVLFFLQRAGDAPSEVVLYSLLSSHLAMKYSLLSNCNRLVHMVIEIDSLNN